MIKAFLGMISNIVSYEPGEVNAAQAVYINYSRYVCSVLKYHTHVFGCINIQFAAF